MVQRMRIAPPQVAFDVRNERIIVEQPVQPAQHRIGLLGQLRHAGEHIFGRIPVDQHGLCPPPVV